MCSEILRNMSSHIWQRMLAYFLADKEEIWGNRDVILKEDSENTIARTGTLKGKLKKKGRLYVQTER